MIEAYAFLAAFTAQILVMSVLCPTWFMKYVRAQSATFPAERFEQLYPGVDLGLTIESYLTRYRVLNSAIAVLGLLPLGWLFNYLQRPDWDDGPVETLAMLYFMAQALPLGLVALIGLKYRKVVPQLLEGKRKASLQRRGLFDFVSPFAVFLAVLTYFVFVGYVVYLVQNPFPGFAGYVNIVGVTLIYAMNSFAVYKQLYGRKVNPFETHASRLFTIGLTVKTLVYSTIVIVLFLSLNFTLVLLDQQRWEPFALSAVFVISAILSFKGFLTLSRQTAAGELACAISPQPPAK